MREIAEIVGISTERVHNIVREKPHQKALWAMGAAFDCRQKKKKHTKGHFKAMCADV